MYLTRSLDSWPHEACALTIGNFDGVHLGHQAIIKQLVSSARALKLPAALLLFEPQPLEFFVPHNAPGRIMTLLDKCQALSLLGLDAVVVLPFNQSLANYPADQFVSSLLYRRLAMRYLLIGDDFRFGQGRMGDFALLQHMAVTLGYQVDASGSHKLGADRVSSTLVRQALARHDFKRAEMLLGRPYQLSGRVIYGRQLARQWGFPTANLRLKRRPALTGVFAVWARLANGQRVPGVANLGTKPSLADESYSLEVHLFAPVGELYGQRLTIEFVQGLRSVQKFSNLDALRAQIQQDVRQAQAIFDGNPVA